LEKNVNDLILKEYWEFSKKLADIADRISISFFEKQQDLEIRTKNDGSFVTKADKQIESQLREQIKIHYPDHGIIGEESGEDQSDSSLYTWIIDPIDGTHGFMRGLPIWATLIALRYDKEIIVSFVSAPALNCRWWAILNNGAFKFANNKTMEISVSTISNLVTAQLLYTGVKESTQKWSGFENILKNVWRERGLGDFWGHCLVAEGAAEIMIDPIANIWDLAALNLIVHESGGIMSNERGTRSFDSGHAISSNKLLHQEIINLLQSV